MTMTREGRSTGHKTVPVSLCSPHILTHGIT